MSAPDTTAAFAGFRVAAHADPALALALRAARERDAFVALTVALGAERGFTFDAAAVRAALREGEARFLAIGADVA